MNKFNNIPSYIITKYTLHILRQSKDVDNDIIDKLQAILNIEYKGEENYKSILSETLVQSNHPSIDAIVRFSNADWFKPKGFVHFTKKIPKYIPKTNQIDFEKYNLLIREVADSNKVGKHAFHPLIHYIIKERRYIPTNKKQRSRAIKIKSRHINFATHIDTHIYAYYAKVILGYEYEKYLEEKPFNESIIAYRKILKKKSISGENRYKSNIDFANDVFDYVSKQDSCAVIIIDITKFFDNINHDKLYQAWKELIKKDRLPKDHYNIFKSVTQFSYVDEKDIIEEFKINDKRELKRKNIHCYCKTPKDFRERVVKKKMMKRCIRKDKNGNHIGIPQGTSISAFLSNLYLLKFDEMIFNYAKDKSKFLYRRYSDDIMIVCEKEDYSAIIEFVRNKLQNELNLEANPKKTKLFLCDKGVNKLKITDLSGNPCSIQYLGFDYNGKVVSLKKQGLAKFYRKMKKIVRMKAHRAGMLTDREIQQNFRPRMVARKKQFKGKGIFMQKINRRFTFDSKNNYLGYALRSANDINKVENIAKSQIAKCVKNLHLEIKKYKPYEEQEEDNHIDFNFF